MSMHPFNLLGSAGAPVRGDLWLPDHVTAPAPVVVGIHGFKGFRRWGFWPQIATAMNEAGFAFANFDMSHNGRGSGVEDAETERARSRTSGREPDSPAASSAVPTAPEPDSSRVSARLATTGSLPNPSGVGVGGLDFDEPALFEKNTWAREEEDLATVLAALRGGRLPEPHRVDAHRLALIGHSRGGGLAVVQAADDRRISAVVTLAPIATVLRFNEETISRGRRTGFIPIVNTRTHETLRFGADAIAEIAARTDLHDISANFAARLTAPLLVVHGEDDSAVLASEGRTLAAAAPHGTFAAIAGGDHVLGCRHPWAGTTPEFERFLTAAREFLSASLR